MDIREIKPNTVYLNCTSQILHPIPVSLSHTTSPPCKSPPETLYIHPHTSLKPSLQPSELSFSTQSSSHLPVDSILNTNQSFIFISSSCNTCNYKKSELKQKKYLKSLCPYCLFLFQIRKGLISLEEFNSINNPRCSLCFFEPSTKNCECGLTFCDNCALKMDSFCYLSDGYCRTCGELKVLVTLECGHKICEVCLKTYSTCIECYKLQCEVCSFMCDSLFRVSILGSICDECVIKDSKTQVSKAGFCKTCKEFCESYQTKYCKHQQCIYCDTGGLCLKCRFLLKNSKFMLRGLCVFCNREGKGQDLFCGHFVCGKCAERVPLRLMNYCCKKCMFSLVKRCVACIWMDLWMWKVKDWVVSKECCNKKICWICCEKISFFQRCGCGKDR